MRCVYAGGGWGLLYCNVVGGEDFLVFEEVGEGEVAVEGG